MQTTTMRKRHKLLPFAFLSRWTRCQFLPLPLLLFLFSAIIMRNFSRAVYACPTFNTNTGAQFHTHNHSRTPSYKYNNINRKKNNMHFYLNAAAAYAQLQRQPQRRRRRRRRAYLIDDASAHNERSCCCSVYRFVSLNFCWLDSLVIYLFMFFLHTHTHTASSFAAPVTTNE